MHCVSDVAGQASIAARGLRALGVDARVVTLRSHPFGYEVDRSLDLDRGAPWRRARRYLGALRDLRDYDVVHFHAGRSFVPLRLDQPLLRRSGRKVFVTFHGSEVRLPSVVARTNPLATDLDLDASIEPRLRRNLRRIARSKPRAIVAYPELLEYVTPWFPNAVVVPQAVDVEPLAASPAPARDRVVIVHAPSVTKVKGTSWVVDAIDRLAQRGLNVELRLLHGVSHTEVLAAMRDADLVVDQLLLGAYGVASIEAMTLGRPVICHVRSDLAVKYPPGLPVVDATPSTIEAVLADLVVDRERRVQLGYAGAEWARRHHSASAVAAQLLCLYRSPG
jgi:glycosyltransferase involved in cell wall biosynthesis